MCGYGNSYFIRYIPNSIIQLSFGQFCNSIIPLISTEILFIYSSLSEINWTPAFTQSAAYVQ